MFQMNFEEQQNGAMIIRRLFGMLFVSKTVAIEEINMGIYIHSIKNLEERVISVAPCHSLFSQKKK